MADYKRLKDPIYGYINIPLEYIYNIIDTANFQRLRRIVQTSYSPLYPSAVHNRFVHSIGVYHLGCMAMESLKPEINRVFGHVDSLEEWISTFKLACLLHDVGHAPFSHTGGCIKMDMDEKKFFSERSIKEVGQCFSGMNISLLSDDDIFFLMKNYFSDSLTSEYFDRRLRRHPVWKSESEYKTYITGFAGSGTGIATFEKALLLTLKYLEKNTGSSIINDDVILELENGLKDVEDSILEDDDKAVQIKEKRAILKVMCALRDFADKAGIESDFVILEATEFNSGFGKIDFASLKVSM